MVYTLNIQSNVNRIFRWMIVSMLYSFCRATFVITVKIGHFNINFQPTRKLVENQQVCETRVRSFIPWFLTLHYFVSLFFLYNVSFCVFISIISKWLIIIEIVWLDAHIVCAINLKFQKNKKKCDKYDRFPLKRNNKKTWKSNHSNILLEKMLLYNNADKEPKITTTTTILIYVFIISFELISTYWRITYYFT